MAYIGSVLTCCNGQVPSPCFCQARPVTRHHRRERFRRGLFSGLAGERGSYWSPSTVDGVPKPTLSLPACLKPGFMASSPELVAHVTRAAVVGATIVALAKGGATRLAGARSTSSVPDAEIPVCALLFVLCELRNLFVLHALSTGDCCCLAPFASQDWLGRRYELADGSWAVVKAWTVRHTRLLKLRTYRDGLLVGPVVGGDAYGGVQARLTSYTGWLEDPLCARV